MLRLAPLALIALLACVSVAQAQDAEDPRIVEAGQLFDQAESDFAAGRIEPALRGYERSMALLEEAGRRQDAVYLAYNIALANRRLDNLEEALAGFERYLAEAPGDAPNRELAINYVTELRTLIESGGTGGSGGGAGGNGTDPPAGGGEVVSPIGIVIAAVGAAAAITGGVIGGVALSNSDAAREGCDAMNRCPLDARDDIASAQTLANVADGLLWGGLAVAATGVVLMFVLADSGDSTTASAFCTDEGCAATVQGRF